jgi:hypothetical protein
MACDETLEARILSATDGWKTVSTKKMFGGVCHLIHGNMFCGVHQRFLILRLGEVTAAAAYSLIGQLRIVAMAAVVTGRFFLKVFGNSRFKIHTGLVGDADENEEHVGQFIAKIRCPIVCLKALLPIGPGNDPGQLPDFFHEHGQVGHFGKVTHAVGFDPSVHGCLQRVDGHRRLGCFF